MAGVVEKVEVRAEEMVASEKERANSISLERQENDTAKSMALRAILSAEDAEWIADVPPEEQRRIFQKVDMRLVPMLALLYLIAAVCPDDHPSRTFSFLLNIVETVAN